MKRTNPSKKNANLGEQRARVLERSTLKIAAGGDTTNGSPSTDPGKVSWPLGPQ